jgi:hypothetical protein
MVFTMSFTKLDIIITCVSDFEKGLTHVRSFLKHQSDFRVWDRRPGHQNANFNYRPVSRNIRLHITEISVFLFAQVSGVPRGWGLGVQTPSPRNSDVLTKPSRIPCTVENTFVTTQQEYGFRSFGN